MLSVEILRHVPMKDGVESVGRLSVNMDRFIHIEGRDGLTPHINSLGYWQVGDEDTGIKAQGPKGDVGPQGIQGIQGPPVPVIQELGQSTTVATSQKLLTDTVEGISNILDNSVGNLENLKTNDKANIVSAVNELKTISNGFEIDYAKKSELTPLASKAEVSKDIGDLSNLPTTDKTSVVASFNEIVNTIGTSIEEVNETIYTVSSTVASDYAKKSELTSLATKSELSIQIADLIGDADADNDTLKEIADRVTALAQADKGLVSATSAQEFEEANREIARKNIDAVSKEAFDKSITTINSTKANKAPEGEEYAFVSAIPDLAPYATKDELTQAVIDLINGADANSDTLKELADKITALAQADKGLVSAEATQTFNETQKKQARDNIEAISEADVNEILEAQLGGGYVSAYLQASQQSGI